MFKLLFYQPIINILYVFFNFLTDYGVAVILTTLFIRMLL